MSEPFDLHSYAHGIRLFNQRKFFDAHEVLEDVWRAAPVGEKKFLQGLIQLAVALHHHSTGNHVGAISVMKRAARNLSSNPAVHGIRVEPLLASIHQCSDCLERGLPMPDPPQLPDPEC